MRNRTLVSKLLSKDMKVMSYLSAHYLRCIIIKNWGGTHSAILGEGGERTMAFGGDRRPWIILLSASSSCY